MSVRGHPVQGPSSRSLAIAAELERSFSSTTALGVVGLTVNGLPTSDRADESALTRQAFVVVMLAESGM